MLPNPGRNILYLSRENIGSIEIEPLELIAEISRCFAAVARGLAAQTPTLSIPVSGSTRFVAKGGVVAEPSVCAIKWFGYFPGNRDAGLPDFHPLILLNEAKHGMPLALMDGTWISEVRTAGISAFAAQHLALPDSSTLGFIACGAQARAHLELLRHLFPITKIYAYSRRLETTRAFCQAAEALGFDAEICSSPRPVVEHSQIVVSSVPHTAAVSQSLDGSWVRPGAYISMVDRGYSWNAVSLKALDLVVTDDMALSGPGGREALNYDPLELSGDLTAVSQGTVRRNAVSDRTALIFSGTGIVDAAVAALIYERACQRNIGNLLDL